MNGYDENENNRPRMSELSNFIVRHTSTEGAIPRGATLYPDSHPHSPSFYATKARYRPLGAPTHNPSHEVTPLAHGSLAATHDQGGAPFCQVRRKSVMKTSTYTDEAFQ